MRKEGHGDGCAHVSRALGRAFGQACPRSPRHHATRHFPCDLLYVPGFRDCRLDFRTNFYILFKTEQCALKSRQARSRVYAAEAMDKYEMGTKLGYAFVLKLAHVFVYASTNFCAQTPILTMASSPNAQVWWVCDRVAGTTEVRWQNAGCKKN